MFTSRAFESWVLIVPGAFVFAVLFGTAAFMGEALLVESLTEPSRAATGLGVAAFAGYIGVATIIRVETRAAQGG